MDVDREECEDAGGRERGWVREEPASPPSTSCPKLTAGTGTKPIPFPDWALCQNIPGEACEKSVPRTWLLGWLPGPREATSQSKSKKDEFLSM